ncbi:MAG: hypothetical protein OHK0036_20590 [Bacteroidia bacterium]
MRKLLLCVLIINVACKKNTNNNTNNNTSPTVTTCFNDNQAGIYLGDGVENNIPFSFQNVSIIKLNCTSIKIQGPSTTYTINSLNASGANGYVGTANTSESASISFTVSGTQYTVDMSIGNSFQFLGTK